jgi:sigma-E factor negative regulatory protein RseC
MESVGIVKSTDGHMAKVIVEMQGGCCDKCEKQSCDIAEKGVETEAVNAARAVEGQKVKVVMTPHTYVQGALVLYVFPVVALILGAIIGQMYLPSFMSIADPELLAALGGFVLFFVSLIIVKILSDRMEKKTEYKSVIQSIIE